VSVRVRLGVSIFEGIPTNINKNYTNKGYREGFIHFFFLLKKGREGFLTKTTDKNVVFVRRDTRKGHQFSNKNVVFASFPQTKILFLLGKPLENLVSWKGYPSLQK
jgi:hypothetical protein